MKVYIVHEIGDYGLWDMTDAKIFNKFKDAEAYNEEYYNQHGHTLVITEWDIDQAKHNPYIHVNQIIKHMKEIIERIIKEYSINRPNYDVTILREDIDNMSDDIVREINRYIELNKIKI